MKTKRRGPALARSTVKGWQRTLIFEYDTRTTRLEIDARTPLVADAAARLGADGAHVILRIEFVGESEQLDLFKGGLLEPEGLLLPSHDVHTPSPGALRAWAGAVSPGTPWRCRSLASWRSQWRRMRRSGSRRDVVMRLRSRRERSA